MKIDLNELNFKKEIKIDEDFTFTNNYPSIKEIKNAHFKGEIKTLVTEETKLIGNLQADLVLIDAIDLSDYVMKLDLNIDEILNLDEKILDINEILWENIVLEVPIRVTNHENAQLSGEGWELKTSDFKEDEIDPRLEKLKDLFKGGE